MSETGELLRELVTFIRRFVVLSEGQAVELALWVMHTHVFDAADATPYQHITSAEKECGKTRLLEVLDLVVAKQWFTGRVSAAALVREIDSTHPTLLLDESDAAFGRDKEYAEALREVLNMGHRRGGKATICVGQGASLATKRFDVFCPKAIAGIGRLPDTVKGRSIPIRLKRKSRTETVERFRWRVVEPEAKSVREELESWAKKVIESLKAARPKLPESLGDRQQDGAEPLLAIAELAGGDWPERAHAALVELWTGRSAEDDSISVRLLADIRVVFSEEKLSTMELLAKLSDIETSPWVELNHGKPLTSSGLARLLKPFDIGPRTIRSGGATPKGYHRDDFKDAWERYLGPEPPPAPQDSPDAVGDVSFDPPTWEEIDGHKSEESPEDTRHVAGVAAYPPSRA